MNKTTYQNIKMYVIQQQSKITTILYSRKAVKYFA